jgi:hypothetical protein
MIIFESALPLLKQASLFEVAGAVSKIGLSSILSSSQFSILPQLPQKMKLASKVIKIDSKII